MGFSAGGGGGVITQFKYDEVSAVSSTISTVTATDNTIPQSSEQVDYGFSITITPTSATHRFIIRPSLWLYGGGTGNYTIVSSLYDSEHSATAAKHTWPCSTSAGFFIRMTGEVVYTPGDTTERTLTLRGGISAQNFTLNGAFYGGTSVSSLTVMEVTAE